MLEFMRLNWGWMLSFVTVTIGTGTYVYTHIKAMRKGVQALLRVQLIEYYNTCKARGFASLSDRDNFERCWVQYEQMGKNGVLNDIRQKFLALPMHEET